MNMKIDQKQDNSSPKPISHLSTLIKETTTTSTTTTTTTTQSPLTTEMIEEIVKLTSAFSTEDVEKTTRVIINEKDEVQTQEVQKTSTEPISSQSTDSLKSETTPVVDEIKNVADNNENSDSINVHMILSTTKLEETLLDMNKSRVENMDTYVEDLNDDDLVEPTTSNSNVVIEN